MAYKQPDDERAAFCDRLKACLHASGFDVSATRLASEFNLRANGASVTVHGARKWLIGDAIPTQARIQTLADWLGVSAAWLRFGEADNGQFDPPAGAGFHMQSEELAFVHDMRLLSGGNRLLLRDILDAMLKGDVGRLGKQPR